MQTSRVAHFDSTTPEYTRAFHLFLSHTDQKEKTMEWLDREVEALPQRRIAIDAGAGTGMLTKWLAGRFARVIGIEPNPSLADEFRTACPTAILIPETIVRVRRITLELDAVQRESAHGAAADPQADDRHLVCCALSTG